MRRASSEYTTPAAKKTLTALLILFFLTFPHYSGYLHKELEGQPIGPFFSLDYFYNIIHFIAQQTLGIVHEGGHGICYIFLCRLWITAAMGTVFQWLFPALIGWYAWRRGQRFWAMVAWFFLGFSMQYTAWYISTAHEEAIVPASKAFLGKEGYHDFNYLLSLVGWVKYDALIAAIVRFFAYMVMFFALLGMVWYSGSTPEDRRKRSDRMR
ncbi:hypothetical protein [Nitratifractor sp.]